MKQFIWIKNIAKLPDNEKQRAIELTWVYLASVCVAIFLLLYKMLFRPEILCLPCDISNVIICGVGLFCLYKGKLNCALNLPFIIPLLIYGYYLSEFQNILPENETVYFTLCWLIVGMIFFMAFGSKISKFYFFFVIALVTMYFHIIRAGLLDEFLKFDQTYIVNPFLILALVFISLRAINFFFEKRLTTSKNELQETTRQISGIIKEWNQPIVLIEAIIEDEHVVDLIIKRINGAFEQHFKISSQEVINQQANFVFNLIFRNAVNTNDLLLINRKPQIEIYIEHLAKWYNINTIHPSKTEFICIFHETTAQNNLIQNLKDSRHRYRVLLEAIPDIFFIIDKDGVYEDFVIKDSDKLKINNADIIGNSVYEVGFSDKMATKIYQCIQDTILNDSIESIEYALDTPNGTFMFEMRLAKLNSNSVISIARDITKRKTAEFNLEEAKQEAIDANKLKSVFLANLSHEIRTPMNAIMGSSEILAEVELPPEDRKEYADALITNGHELMKMIDDTINLSKIETHTVDVNLTFCQINALLRELFNMYEPIADTKRSVELELSIGVATKQFGFDTDRYLLFESLSKLIDNAIKFTNTGTVTFGFEMYSTTMVEFFVEDSGKGIPLNEIDRIFERYYKIEKINTVDNRGSGLGLSIAKEFVTIIGGRLSVDSELDKGSRFSFKLPFKSGEGYMKVVH